jgi:hypothetical protein
VGKPHSLTFMDQDIQDRGYQLRRIPLLRGWVNKGDRLDPAPHSCFVAQVLFAELPLQVALLAFDDPRWITNSATGRRRMAHSAFARLAMPA